VSGPGGAGRLSRALAELRRPPIQQVVLASYRFESLRDLTAPVATALMEGGFIGVLADKVYHVHPTVLALISAAPMFGNLSSFLWARLAQGRRKVPFLLALQGLFALCVGGMALLPAGGAGAVGLVCAMVGSRLVLGGIVTVRSLVWTLNYPREARARVTARLHLIAIATMTATSLLGSAFLDADPEGFRSVYAVGVVFQALGIFFFSRVSVLGEQDHLRVERADTGAQASRSSASLLRSFSVLRHDPLYARYQACQFVLGVSNMMIQAPMVYLISRQLQASYSVSVAVLMAIPLAFSVIALPVWAAYLDRVHVSEYRARSGWLWVVAQLLTFVGAARGSIGWLTAGSIVFGLARGGGALAWNLGHNDFARAENVGHYMGVHVTLTGLRGAFAPFLGMFLYVGASWFPAIGAWTFLLATALSTLSSLGFVALHRRIHN
jgi:MFS family permease